MRGKRTFVDIVNSHRNWFLQEASGLGYNTYSRKCNWSYLLGHGSALQERTWSFSPLHSLPPCCGGGLVQDRVRPWVPPPHVTLHCAQAFQSLHLPSTVKEFNSPFHMDNIASCLPTKTFAKPFFSIPLGITVVQRELEDKGYVKFGGVDKVHYGRCENVEWW